MRDIEEIKNLKEIFNDHIYSVIKYGFGKRNFLVVVNDMDIPYMMKIRPYIRRIRKQKNILILTKENVSKKNIGVDFLNIKLTSVVIYGQDIFKGASIDTLRLKRQIKYEANRILVNLRNEILDTGWKRSLKDILFSVIPRVLPLIVAHLYVLGEKIPNAIPDTINRYVKHNSDALVLLKIRKDISQKEVEILLKDSMVFLEKLVDL
ncbi:hypothetical protein H6503_02780 [Candidatus Woesearchaeota archaeon]|nr:hypothetical protein [Candidatus Woesearchaeota archaeon]